VTAARLIDADLSAEIQGWRRKIHANPELAFEEVDTAALVARELAAAGLEVSTGIASTGVVGTLRLGDGPSIALRADMDALPIVEQTGLDYASRRDACMHACGHDGHTAMLLGAAKVLSKRTDLRGTVHFIFQPAEENEGGARAMIEEGVLDRFECVAVFALHNMPGLAVGQFCVMPGPMMASFDRFDITVTGRGGHGAFPHLVQNPISAASALTLALDSIVSAELDSDQAAVLTVGRFSGDGAYNVIPGEVVMQGSVRTLTRDTRMAVKQRMTEVCAGIAKTHRVNIELDYQDGYPVLVNHSVETKIVIDALSAVAGKNAVETDFPPVMGSEDFAFFLQHKPGCYFLLGNGVDSAMIHTPEYDFNDAATEFGVAAFEKTVEKAFAHYRSDDR